MSHFIIKVSPCIISRNESNTIARKSIDEGLAEVQVVQAYRHRLALTLKKSRQYRDKTRIQAKQILDQAQHQAKKCYEQWQEQARIDAISNTVTWLVNEKDIEQRIICSLSDRINDQVRSVITQWSETKDLSPILIQRLSALIEKNVKEENSWCLTINPSMEDQLTTLFGDKVTIKSETSIDKGQAILSSSFVTLNIDINKHLNLLLEQLG